MMGVVCGKVFASQGEGGTLDPRPAATTSMGVLGTSVPIAHWREDGGRNNSGEREIPQVY